MAIDKQRFFQINGFDSEGRGTVVYGDTMPYKDELKKMGAKFNGNLRKWIVPGQFDSPFPGTETDDVESTDLFINYDYRWPNNEMIDVLKKRYAEREARIFKRLNADNPSDFIGEVGDKVTVNVTRIILKNEGYGDFGYYYTYEVLDNNNNIIVFNSSKRFPEVVEKITGTVKKHNEYRGIKSTVLNRVKVVE